MRLKQDPGIVFGLAAYGLWGLFPIFWKALKSVPAFEVLCHRAVWSLPLLTVLLALQGRLGWWRALRDARTSLTLLCSGSLLALNWYTFIWAITAGRVVEASLGYFITPLFNVLLGVLFLRERLRPWQGVSVAIAFGAVLSLAVGYGTTPWVSLILATTFAVYGLLRKTAALGSLEGLATESAFMFLPAFIYLMYLEATGHSTFTHTGLKIDLLLVVSGAVTAIPLLLFALAARRIQLATLGILQFVAPSLHFILGVFVYGEPLSRPRLLAFIAIWLALVIFTVEALARRRALQAISGK